MTDLELDSFFKRLLRRYPTPEERELLYETADILDIKRDEPLWLILVVMQHYATLYRTIPNEIEEVVQASRALIKESIKQTELEARASLLETVKQSAREMAVDAARAHLVGRVTVAAVAITAMLLLTLGVGTWAGFQRGKNETYPARAWVDSFEGQKAYQMSQMGSMGIIAACHEKAGRVVWPAKGAVTCVPASSRKR